MKIMNKLKKYFLTSKSWVIDLEDCTTIPSGKTIVDTVQNWANENQKKIIFVSTMKPITFMLDGTKYIVKINRERGAYTLYITNCE
ncbi:DUF4318 domain-containing protein [Clostridium sp. OS1-26]|uniref:DUF4318 domain-containing protein n=1 Tax=Clostridium sp. OS1-26 TaxID=3070681 RepID=UPI0027DF00E9|nr:DUF4318 domain-containing protein [Clostridium sp. OS1-26]WML32791.1 DUF4318 domain-containing protein [Clostridium sp. OS1-26]